MFDGAKFERLRALVLDPVYHNRQNTHAALFQTGFREIETVASADIMQRQITTNRVDLLVAEITGADADVCRVIRRIRKNEIGANPFVVIIATCWDLSADMVRAVVDSGADDLLGRPFSINQLQQRLASLMRGQRQFVVTSDYIGPERRKDPARQTSPVKMDVPNPLELATAANAGEAVAEMEAAIIAARSALNISRMKRLGFQIGILVKLITEEAGRADAVAQEQLRDYSIRLGGVVAELMRRAREAEMSSLVDLAAAMRKVARAIEASEAEPRTFQLLNELSMAIQLALEPDLTEGAIASEIASTVAKIKSRKATARASAPQGGSAIVPAAGR
jgi:DNA-binding response OmpR family regulator